MSRENVEAVRRIYDAVARRDSVTPYEIYAEDIVWDMSGMGRAYGFGGACPRGSLNARRLGRAEVALPLPASAITV